MGIFWGVLVVALCAAVSANSLPSTPQCDGTHKKVMSKSIVFKLCMSCCNLLTSGWEDGEFCSILIDVKESEHIRTLWPCVSLSLLILFITIVITYNSALSMVASLGKVALTVLPLQVAAAPTPEIDLDPSV